MTTPIGQNKISFHGRCIQIKDAQWVCHALNSTLPHSSTTRMIPAFKKIIYKNPDLVPTQKKIFNMMNILDALEFMKDNFLLNLPNAMRFPQHQKHYQHIINAIKTILFLSNSRLRSEFFAGGRNIRSILDTVSKYKVGNCYEDARLSELVLLMNGVKNACTAELQIRFQKDAISHNVCVFNRDGSPFNGVINKHTIIIDNWAGKIDFADNMIKFYRNQCKEFFDIPDDKVLDIWPIEKFELKSVIIDMLKEKFPQLIFKSKSRQFMPLLHKNKP